MRLALAREQPRATPYVGGLKPSARAASSSCAAIRSDQHCYARRGTGSNGVRSFRAHPKESSSSTKGVAHAKTDVMGDRRGGCFGGGHDNGRSFASRRDRTNRLAHGRRYAWSHGRCAIHVERPPLLLVQHRLAGRRLVPLWLQVAPWPGLGRPGRVARVETARRAPTDPSSPRRSSAESSVEARPAKPASATSGTAAGDEVMTSLPVAAGQLRRAR